MFAKIRENIEISIAIGLALVAVVIFSLYMLKDRKVESLTKTTAQQEVQIVDLMATVEKSSESVAVTQKIQEATVTDLKQAATKQDAIARTTKEKVKEVEDKYHSLTPSPAVDKQKSDEVSKTLIDGLWQAWCEATGEWKDPNCTVFKPDSQTTHFLTIRLIRRT